MAEGANIAYQKNIELTKGVAKAHAELATQLQQNIATNAVIIAQQKELSALLSSAKGAKEYAIAQKAIENNIKAVALQEKELIKVEALRAKEQEKLTREVLKTEQAQKKAAQTASSAKTEYQKLSAELTKNRNAAKDVALQYGLNSKEFKKAATEVNALDSKLKKIDATLGQNQRNVGNYQSGIRSLGSSVKGLIGAFGVVGGIQLFAKAMKSAFDISKKYEKQNAVLASILGVTRKETILLQKESQRLGATTVFSATQVVELQTELARLGKTESEIIASTEGIINATIALGSETGETAALVGATLNAFQLGASESGRVADVLTLSTQRTALSFEKLNTAIPIASGAAAAAGVSFETMVAQLGQAADRGIDASTAATSLRNIYITLADKGITLSEALNKINTSQNKLTAANDLFGKRSAVTALALAATTDKTIALTDALENAGGTAERVAKEQLDTLDGKLKLLNSSWEGFVLAVNNGDTALGSLAKTSVEFLTNALNGLTTLGARYELLFTNVANSSALAKEQLIAFGTFESGININEGLASFTKYYNQLSDEIKSTLTLQESLTQSMIRNGESAEDAAAIAEFYVKQITNLTNASNETVATVNALSESENVLAKAETDLIKIQEDLLKLAKEMPGATEDEIAFRNKKIIVIKEEIDRLKALGEEQKKVAKQAVPDQIELPELSFQREDELFDIDKLADDEINAYIEKEIAKTEALKEQEQIRADIKAEFLDQAARTAVDIGNSIFDNAQEKLTQETEAIQAEYDTRLSNEQLDEEQRSLIEAERDAKLNEQKKKERDLEKKQFLFNQAVQAAEVGIDTFKKVAAIQATAAVLASNPLTAAFAPIALSQIPLVIGTGAAAGAAILAKSIPAFDKGIDSAPGGGFLVGEERPEFMEHKGRVSLIDKPTFFGDEYKGAKIWGGAESAKIMDKITHQEVINSVSSVSNDIQGQMIAAAVEKSFANHSSRMINEMKLNRPKRQTGLDQMKRTDDIIKRFAE